jgi:hypothetical protein
MQCTSSIVARKNREIVMREGDAGDGLRVFDDRWTELIRKCHFASECRVDP